MLSTSIVTVLLESPEFIQAILVPKNYAHGFISLTDNVLMQYFMDKEFSQASYKGFNVKKYLQKEFPNLDLIISDKDTNLSDYKP